MSTDKIIRRNQVIAQHISEIVFRNERRELAGVLEPTNEAFREVLIRQERLLNAVELLLEQMPARPTAEIPLAANPTPAQATDIPRGRPAPDDAGAAPLRAAKGDDDLMSEEPVAPEHK